MTSRSKATNRRTVSYFNQDDHDFPEFPRQVLQNEARNSRPQCNLYSEVAKGKSYERNNNDDISNERLMQIFFDVVDALQRCQNKYDKLRV